MIVIDAAPIIALADRRDPMRLRVLEVLQSEPGPLLIPAPVTAEIDYLLTTRFGPGASEMFLQDLEAGTYRVECLLPQEYGAVLELSRRYRDLRPGLADLAVVVVASRFATRRILSFDERHFRAMTPLQGGVFEVLPADRQ